MKRIKMRDARRPDEGVPEDKPGEAEAGGLVWEETDALVTTASAQPTDETRERVRDRLRRTLLGNPYATGGLVGSIYHDVRLRDSEVAAVVAPGEYASSLDTMAELTMEIARLTEPSTSIFDRIAAACSNVGRAAGGASRVVRAQPFIDPTRAINIDPAEPGSDITVVTVRNPDGLISVPRADGISRSDIQDALRAALVTSISDSEADANRTLAQGWRRQYFEQTTRALQSELGSSIDALSLSDMHRMRGQPNDVDAMFERLATLFTWQPELRLTTFWGANTARVGIFLLTGGNAESMVGFKVTDPTTWYYQELDLGERESDRRAMAVGLVIGWAMRRTHT